MVDGVGGAEGLKELTPFFPSRRVASSSSSFAFSLSSSPSTSNFPSTSHTSPLLPSSWPSELLIELPSCSRIRVRSLFPHPPPVLRSCLPSVVPHLRPRHAHSLHRYPYLFQTSSWFYFLFANLELTSFLPALRSSFAFSPLFPRTEQSLKAPPYVLLDLTHRDSKTRSLLEIVECRDSIWRDVFSLEAGLGGLVGKEEGGVLLGAF